ncbi:MAG: M48 family metalloprotease [Candidatus Omnitrophica bacterium]|nr:M48 family metalloprotease [Candidatus Omnitrophota bacterium]
MVDKSKEKAKRYHRIKIVFFFIDFMIGIIFLCLFMSLGSAQRLEQAILRGFSFYWLRIAVYATGLSFFLFFIHLPTHLYVSYFLEKQFGLSLLTFKRWCAREGKKELLSLLFFLLLVETGYFFVWTMSERWWIGFGILWFLYSWILTQLFPVWIVPLFYRYTPVEDQLLIQTLKTFARSQGRDIHSVRAIDLSRDTRKANAAVLGIGKLKKIVLGDTLLRSLSHDEIKVVFAHELGHDKEHHVAASLLFSAFLTFGGIYLVQQLLIGLLPLFQIGDVGNMAALPLFLLLFSLLNFCLMPLQNGFSRMLERRADAFALRTTGLREIFVSSMKKLAQQNLEDESPDRLIEFFFYSHPSILRRIEFAEQF